MRDQIRSFERSSWNAPAICRASRKPCSHIMSSRKASWLSLMNSVSSPASVKSVCAASSVTDCEPLVAVARHGGGRDREQRSAEAVADRVDLLGPARSRRPRRAPP